MVIIDFTRDHVFEAQSLAKRNYEEERGCVPALPTVEAMPDLNGFAENGLGVAAFEGGEMVGFLCGRDPWDNAWDIPGLRNIFSPMGTNGAVGENRMKTYALLYQAAGEKWVRAGAESHGICLYAHDREAQEQLYRYGFGLRCVDAIRGMERIAAPVCEGYDFSELMPDKILEVLPLANMHVGGYIDSPFFMFRAKKDEIAFLEEYRRTRPLYLIARHKGRIVAYVKAKLDGENFLCNTSEYMHVNGAYCLPEHRGNGLNQKLLNMLVQKLREQGYTHLGVDFESINPSGSGFWLKYFTAYTYSVIRRIDEGAVRGGEDDRQRT